MGSLKTKRAVTNDHHNGELDAWKTLLFVMYFAAHIHKLCPLLPELLLFSLPCYCSTGAAASTHACQVSQLILEIPCQKLKVFTNIWKKIHFFHKIFFLWRIAFFFKLNIFKNNTISGKLPRYSGISSWTCVSSLQSSVVFLCSLYHKNIPKFEFLLHFCWLQV